MKNTTGMVMGEAEPLTDAQKRWLEKNNGEMIWMTLWAKYKKKEMSLATIIQAFKYHLEIKGLEKIQGIGWVKTRDLPRMGLIENTDGGWSVVVTQEMVREEVRIGRRTIFEEKGITTCRYVEYLKEEDNKKKFLSINKDSMIAEAINLFGEDLDG